MRIVGFLLEYKGVSVTSYEKGGGNLEGWLKCDTENLLRGKYRVGGRS